MNAKATLAEDDISRRSQSYTGSHFAWLAWLCMTKATMSHQGTRMPKTLHLPKPPSDKWHIHYVYKLFNIEGIYYSWGLEKFTWPYRSVPQDTPGHGLVKTSHSTPKLPKWQANSTSGSPKCRTVAKWHRATVGSSHHDGLPLSRHPRGLRDCHLHATGFLKTPIWSRIPKRHVIAAGARIDSRPVEVHCAYSNYQATQKQMGNFPNHPQLISKPMTALVKSSQTICTAPTEQ
ncbi:unnamed protein product [Prunus armeniaca]